MPSPNPYSLTLDQYRRLEAAGKIERPLAGTEPIGGGSASKRAAAARASMFAPPSAKSPDVDELHADPTPSASERVDRKDL